MLPFLHISQARKEDSLAKIADRTVVSIGQLLSDNIQVIRSLDKPLSGLRLRICNPDPATISQGGRTVGMPSTTPRTARGAAPEVSSSGATTVAKPPQGQGSASAAKVAAPEPQGDAAAAAADAASPLDGVQSQSPEPEEPDVSATEAEGERKIGMLLFFCCYNCCLCLCGD
jgi:hypothetical protein